MWLGPSGFSLRDMVGRKPDKTLFTMMNRPNVHMTLFTRRGMEFILLLMRLTIRKKKCTKKKILYIYIRTFWDYLTTFLLVCKRKTQEILEISVK